MAIKLESTVKGIECLSLLTIESPGESPSVGLKVEAARSLVNEKWVEDPAKAKQIISFIGEDGPVELSGIVPQDEAVEMAAAYRVILQIDVSPTTLPAYEAGRKSKTLLAVSPVKVVEVWATSKKCLWKSSETVPGTSKGATFDPNTGRIEGKAA